MVRLPKALALLVCCVSGSSLLAEGAGDATGAGEDIKLLRQVIEQQSRQIDVLAREIARLNLLLEGKAGTGNTAASTSGDAAPSTPEAASSGEADHSASQPSPRIARAIPSSRESAPPTSGVPVHVVSKGETLTSIAHHYKVTVPELLKVNKVSDVRKLQIGQSLSLPPGAKIPESSPSPQPQ